jgi:hypothetical protein
VAKEVPTGEGDPKFANYIEYLEILKKMKGEYCMPLVLARNELILQFDRKDPAAKLAFDAYVDFMEKFPTSVNEYMNDKRKYPLWKVYADLKSAIWLDKTARKELIHILEKSELKKNQKMSKYYKKYYTANLLENYIKRLAKSPLEEYLANAEMADTKKLKLYWLKIAGEYKLEPEEDKKKFAKKRMIQKEMLSLVMSEGYLDQMGEFKSFLDFVQMFLKKFPDRREELKILATCFGGGLTYGKGKEAIYFEVSKKDLKRVRVHLFEKEDKYLSFMAVEQSERFTDGESVTIAWEDLRKKILRYESFAQNHTEYRTLEVLGTIASMINAYTCGLAGDRDKCRTDNEIGLSYKAFLDENRSSQFYGQIEAMHKKYYPDN